VAGTPGVMRSIRFAAWRDGPPGPDRASRRYYVTLAELLVRLGSFGLGLTWKVRIQYADQPMTRLDEIERASSGSGVGTLELLARVAPDVQFVDGELVVALREFDSTSWDLCTTDDSVIREIRRHYPDAVPVDEDLLQDIPRRIDQWEM
jgi:hypothetical protein